MNKFSSILVLFALIFPTYIFAQGHTQCGTFTTPSEIDRLKRNIQASKSINVANRDVTWVPLQWHLIARTNGTGRIKEEQIFESMCRLNLEFEPMNMQFFIHEEFNYINNDDFYNLESTGAGGFQYFLHKVPDAVNLFVGQINVGGNTGGGVAGFYSPSDDVIHLDRSYVNFTDEATVPHEVGHFFSLPHTFYGWETTVYDPSQPTPTSVNWGFWNPVELVDRENGNCENAGDYFCDTPADYISQGGSGCSYNGNAVDPDGVAIDPDETNMMSYFFGCDDYLFSEDQQAAVLADFDGRPAIHSIPTVAPITDFEANLNYPIWGEYVNANNAATFTWEEVPNATHYVVIISPVSSLDIVHDRAIVTTNSFTTSGELTDGRENYYWGVYAYNAVSYCHNEVSKGQFSTDENSVGVKEISGVNDFVVMPNPISNTDELTLFIDSERAVDVDFKLYSATGKNVRSLLNNKINQGKNQFSMNINELPAGMYYLSVQNKEGVLNKKIMILD